MSLPAGALLALLAAIPAALAQPLPTLTLVLSGKAAHQDSPVFNTMRAEAARLVEAAGYRLSWKTGSEIQSGTTFEHLIVVRLSGQCQLRSTAETATAMPVRWDVASLGATAVSDGRVLPFVEIGCDRTWEVIAQFLRSAPHGSRESMYGRSLGRVVAHELYHVLAQTKDHADNGASKPCFRAADLLNARFHFDAVSLAQMRPATSALIASAAHVATADDAAAEEPGAEIAAGR